MANIFKVDAKAVKHKAVSIEDGLAFMCKYGRPRLSKHERGWHCSINVFVTGEGVSFEVNTGFDEKTPADAVNICYSLLHKALTDIKNTQ